MPKKNEQVESEYYKKAKKRVDKIKEFYEHLLYYVGICVVLIIVNVVTGTPPWAAMVMFFWGIGLFFHWYDVFGKETLLGKDWEDQKIAELMAQERGEKLKRNIAVDYFTDADEDETQNLKRSG